jgi:hypothetical protein
MREAVATHTTRAAETLRRHRLAAGTITVFLMTNLLYVDETQYDNEIMIMLLVGTID